MTEINGISSDLDLLVTVGQEATLLDVLRMEIDLEELLGVKVEVVTEGGLRGQMKERVLSEAREIRRRAVLGCTSWG